MSLMSRLEQKQAIRQAEAARAARQHAYAGLSDEALEQKIQSYEVLITPKLNCETRDRIMRNLRPLLDEQNQRRQR